jgi:hypothetical protein
MLASVPHGLSVRKASPPAPQRDAAEASVSIQRRTWRRLWPEPFVSHRRGRSDPLGYHYRGRETGGQTFLAKSQTAGGPGGSRFSSGPHSPADRDGPSASALAANPRRTTTPATAGPGNQRLPTVEAEHGDETEVLARPPVGSQRRKDAEQLRQEYSEVDPPREDRSTTGTALHGPTTTSPPGRSSRT